MENFSLELECGPAQPILFRMIFNKRGTFEQFLLLTTPAMTSYMELTNLVQTVVAWPKLQIEVTQGLQVGARLTDSQQNKAPEFF